MDGPDGDGADEGDVTGNYLLNKQRDKDRQVSILKKVNEDLTQLKIYTHNFDKLAEYNEDNGINSARLGKKVRWLHSPSAEVQPKLLMNEEDEE